LLCLSLVGTNAEKKKKGKKGVIWIIIQVKEPYWRVVGSVTV